MISSPSSEPGENMLKERMEIANNVATALFDAEAAVDAAIVAIGALANMLPQAQGAAKLSPVVGDAAFGHLGATVKSLFEGRTSIVALHHELDTVKTAMGLRNFRIVGTGDAAKILCPEGLNDAATKATSIAA